jgi:ferric-dicitrate binding protein FerR (iron transport regulator)
MEHDLTLARLRATTDEDAAAIAWAQDRIEALEAALERAAGAIHGLNANFQPSTINGEETLARNVLAGTP